MHWLHFPPEESDYHEMSGFAMRADGLDQVQVMSGFDPASVLVFQDSMTIRGAVRALPPPAI